MTRASGHPIVVGKVARAEICPCGGSVVLSLGSLSRRLDGETAEDVAETLLQALALLGAQPAANENAVDPEERN